MFLHLTVLFLAALFCKTSCQTDSNEIFHDDFSGKEPSSLGKWNALDGPDAGLEFYLNEANNSVGFPSAWRPNNVLPENNSLHLRAEKRIQADGSYTSASVNTAGKFEFLYGEVEVRARLPAGKGLWPSLSLEHVLPNHNCSKEDCSPSSNFIAIMDAQGHQAHDTGAGIFRRQPKRSNFVYKTVTHPTDMSLDFHLYKVIWTPSKLSWYIDNQEVFQVTDTHIIPTLPLQIVMKLSLSGRYAGPPFNETGNPSDFVIDHVVVRQLKTENGLADASKKNNLNE